ncbi:unnamed protein product [Heterobilharzia americana]|nr:unnamed protein product [Heterobilharzia americana]
MPPDTPHKSRFYTCSNVNEEEYISFLQSTISAVVLTLICLLGVIGNSLVIIVYCVKPRRQTGRLFANRQTINNSPNQKTSNSTQDSFTSDKSTSPFQVFKAPATSNSTLPSHLHTSIRRRNAFSQQNLILLLALVDLLTCVLILPCDIYRVVNYTHANRHTTPSPMHDIYGTLPMRRNFSQLHMDNTSGSGFYFKYELDAILTLLRNIVFACEGSLLAAIAFERYMILVERDICKCACCLLCVAYKNKDKNNPNRVNGTLPNLFSLSKTSQSPSNDSSGIVNDSAHTTRSSPTGCVNDVRETPPMTPLNSAKSSNTKYKVGVLCKPSTCIMSILVSVTMGTCLLECILIVLHFSKWDCQLTDLLRELVNQIYILCTFLSFFIITYLYMRIFMTVRENDLRRQKWSAPRSALHTSLRIINESNAVSQPSENDSEMETVVRLADESASNVAMTNGDSSIFSHHPYNSQLVPSSRSRPPIRFVKQLSCDQVTSDHCCYQLDPRIGQVVAFRRRGILKLPSMSALFEQGGQQQQDKLSAASMRFLLRRECQLSEKDVRKVFTNCYTAPPSPRLLPLGRLIPRRVVRSHRTGLMIFISTVVFYATLFPVLWVHFKFWWRSSTDYPVNDATTLAVSSGRLNTTGSDSGDVSGNSTVTHTNNHGSSFMTVVHHEFYYVNNAVNFFIYSLFNQSFRARLRLLLAKH